MKTLKRDGVELLICSSACGADLLALQAASELGIPFRIILPFEPSRFRETSVTDRPGKWGPLFDNVISIARSSGDLIVLDGDPGSDSAYRQATRAIIVEAKKAARDKEALAIVVWEGSGRSGSDATEEFRRLAAEANFKERTVITSG